MSRIRKLPPDFSQQKKPRMSVDQEEQEMEEEFENDVSESILDDSINEIDEKIIDEENNLSESVLDEEEVTEEEEEDEFLNYVSETTEQGLNAISGTVRVVRARMTPRMRVNNDYVHHSIQVSQWVEEEIEEEEEVEDDINEFADQDMSEYLETRTYHAPPAPPVVADHEEEIADPVVADHEEEACAICLHEYQDGDTIGILQCNHEFHAECINKWLQRKTACPFCRSSVLPTSLFESASSSL